MKQLLLALSIFCSTSCLQNDFDASIEQIKKSGTVELAKAAKGLPYYLKQNLDVTWDKTSKDVVRFPNMSFVDQDGIEVTSKDLNDKRTLVSFFFTSCNGFCPMLLSKLKKLSNNLKKEETENFQLFVISVDPEFDTVERLKEIQKKHGLNFKNWKLLRGKKEDVYSLAKDYLSNEIKRIDDMQIRQFAHSEQIFIFDKNAALRGVVNGMRDTTTKKSLEVLAQLEK